MTREKLESLTVTSLRALARDAGIPGRSRMRKRALVRALLELATPATGETPELPESIAPTVDGPVEAPAEELSGLAAGSPPVGGGDVAKPDTVEVVVPPATEPEAITAPRESSPAAPAAPSAVEPSEPAPPDSVFIDRGAVLPEGYGQAVVRVMIRDPHTAFVYWEPAPGHRPRSWEVQAWAEDRLLASFQVGGDARDGYLHVPTAELRRVVVVSTEGAAMVAASPVAEPTPAPEELWVTLQPAAFQAAPSPPFHHDRARSAAAPSARWPGSDWILQATEPGDDSPVAAHLSRPPSTGQDTAVSAPISAYTTPR